MATAVTFDDARQRLITITCDACGRSVATTALPASALRTLVSWDGRTGVDWCVLCQKRRGSTPRFTSRIARNW